MKTIEEFKELLPLGELHAICERDKAHFEDPKLYLHTGKYVAKMDLYLEEKIHKANTLGLSESKNLKIIDIGSGIGIFPWVCQKLGHQCDHTYFDAFDMYKESWKVLGLKEPTFLNVTHFGDWVLPSTNYDLIVSTRTVFDRYPKQWTHKQWRVFLKNALNYLNDGGKVFIKSNYLEPHPRNVLLNNYKLDGFNSWTFSITKEEINKL